MRYVRILLLTAITVGALGVHFGCEGKVDEDGAKLKVDTD